MESLDENAVPDISNVSSRKRKRKQPFKDRILLINVKQNMKTGSTTQRHSTSKEDCVSNNTRLGQLPIVIFNKPSYVFSESLVRQFESRPISDKLTEPFKRMTLTKTEETNHNMVDEFFSNQPDNIQPEMSLQNIELSMVNVPVDSHNAELPQQMEVVDAVVEE